jgi:hypothetical protein
MSIGVKFETFIPCIYFCFKNIEKLQTNMARIINPNSCHHPVVCISTSSYKVSLTLFFAQNGFKGNKVLVLTS